MAGSAATEASFVHAAHTFLVNTGRTAPETAMLLCRLSEELHDSKPATSGFKLKRCLSLQPAKFVLETRSLTDWIYALPCEPIVHAEARVVAQGKGGAIAGAGDAVRPPVQPAAVANATRALPQMERLGTCAVVIGSVKDPKAGVSAAKKAVSSAAVAQKDKVMSLPIVSNHSEALCAAVTTASHALPQMERFKRCATLFAQSHKADVNAHDSSTDQMLQVIVRLAQVLLPPIRSRTF